MVNEKAISKDEADLLLYLADELDPQARVSLEARIRSERALQEQLRQLKEVDDLLLASKERSAGSVYVSDRALHATLRLVRENAISPAYVGYAKQAGFRFHIPPYAVAAGIAVLFTFGFIGWLYTTSPIIAPQNNQSNNMSNYRPPGPFSNVGLSNGFLPVGFEQYGESSRQIDQALDALSVLADFEEATETQ